MSLPSEYGRRPEGRRGLPRGRPAPFNPEWIRRLLEALECESSSFCLRLLDVLRRAVSDERGLRWARAIWEFQSHPRWWSGEVEDRGDLPPKELIPEDAEGYDVACACRRGASRGCLSGRSRHWTLDSLPRLTIASCCATPLEALLARPDRAVLYREACSLGAEGCLLDVVRQAHPMWDAAILEAAAAAGPFPRGVGESLLLRAVGVHAPELIEQLLGAGAPRDWLQSHPPPSAISNATWAACVEVRRGARPRLVADFVRRCSASDLLRAAPWLEAEIGRLPPHGLWRETVRAELLAEVQQARRWSEPRAAWLGAVLRGIRRRVAQQPRRR